jgi:hypothetical protein
VARLSSSGAFLYKASSTLCRAETSRKYFTEHREFAQKTRLVSRTRSTHARVRSSSDTAIAT